MSEKQVNVLDQPLVVINLGLPGFAENLATQDVDVVHVEWKPPAEGDQEMIDLLDNLL